MKITVFGATGETGKKITEQALEMGYEVVAFARNPSKLNVSNEHLTVVQGQLSDVGLVESAVKGSSAVLSALGPRGGSKDKPLTQGMQNIIVAMKKQNVRRLIITSTLSAKDTKDKPNFKTKAMVNLVKTTMHAAYEDIVNVAETVRASDLDWTIVRLAILNNKPKSGKVKAGYVGSGEVATQISRADIADFMLKQITEMKYLHEAPAISN
ncbi:MAG: SDR family oxidoreductase [Candidatus Bathyarchaeia archaeon]